MIVVLPDPLLQIIVTRAGIIPVNALTENDVAGIHRKNKKKWAQKDLNLRPTDYESAALTTELWALIERRQR